MTPEEAAWVREHIWLRDMREIYRDTPGYYLACACQWNGPCINDPRRDVHTNCHVGRHPLPGRETWIQWPDGRLCAFAEPYRHPTASATGWHYERTAMVWLADRRCRWACACDCGHPRDDIAYAPARHPGRRQPPTPAALPGRYETVTLPGLEHLAGVH